MSDTLTETRRDLIDAVLRSICEAEGWNYCHEYGEPGYGDANTRIIILGSFWKRDAEGGLYGWFDKHPRFEAAMREAGIELEWDDEWTIDHDNDKCYRTSPDSYGWTPSHAYTEGGDILTPDDDVENWLEHAMGDEYDGPRALYRTQLPMSKVEEAGFVRWPDEDEFYESGWHPGQTDDPMEVIKRARQALGEDTQVIIYVTGVGQFDTRWVVYTRQPSED